MRESILFPVVLEKSVLCRGGVQRVSESAQRPQASKQRASEEAAYHPESNRIVFAGADDSNARSLCKGKLATAALRKGRDQTHAPDGFGVEEELEDRSLVRPPSLE